MLSSCGDIYDEKNMTRKKKKKKKEQMQRKTIRMWPILNSTVQLVIVNLYTKYQVSI